jgi:anti-sigma B factor antagonist
VEIEIRTEENRAILTLEGDFTSARDVAAVQEKVNDLLRKGVRHFTFNLEAVEYVDSAGLGRLVQLYTTVTHAGGDVKLAALPERLTKLLEGPEKTNFFMELPDSFGTRIPMLNPLIWLVLLVTFAILVTIASHASFSVW